LRAASSHELLAAGKGSMSKRGNAATAGMSMGSALSMILSFELNHSVLWAIVHGLCSWFYVIYRAYKGNY